MKPLTAENLEVLWRDEEARDVLLRSIVEDRLRDNPPPVVDGHVVATYFLALRSLKLADAVEEISYHATSGERHPVKGSLIEQCTAHAAGVDAFDATGRIGLAHVAFPLKMLLQGDGHLTSSDLLHTVAGAAVFDMYENQDARLVRLGIPEAVLRTFPGPAYGPRGVRRLTGFGPDQPAFGTILKPTAGITPEEVGQLVAALAGCRLFLFIKEDEDLYPNLPYSPVVERTKRAVRAIADARDQRGGLGLIFAPHVTGAPHEIVDTVMAVVNAGATGVMFSETFAGGTVRMVREATKHLAQPPVIYGHNAGIGVKTRAIWREVIDLLARLDGIDFRQTAPLRPGAPHIRPYGDEWRASEEALTCDLPGIAATTIVRAGALDQGNIGLNLADAERRGIADSVLFLAGSAINSIKDAAGKADPAVGMEAMLQAIDVYRSGELRDTSDTEYVSRLVAIAKRDGLTALGVSLRQRYGLGAA
jgi:ribulose 1,5-bisphosphate carboxylase large subunit-like protein